MLAKYGIRKDPKPATPSGDLDTLSKTAPHLAAIISRTASRTRKALPFRIGQPGKHASPSAPSTSDYRPSSTSSFLARLSTYKLTTYGNKPPAIDAVAASKCGWINDGKDRLVCGICGVSWVVAGRDGMTRDAANALVEKQRVQLVEAHKDGCPWKTRQCDDSVYRIPLQAPLSTIREIKSRAVLLDTVMKGVGIKHPLTAAQVQSLVSIINSVSLPSSSVLDEEPTTPTGQSVSSAMPLRVEPSETSILTALFGWSILPPAAPEPIKTPSSVSRAGSVAPTTPSRHVVPRTPPRAPSVAPREGTVTPSSSRSSMRISTANSLLSQHSVGSGFARPDATLLHCPLCQRRVGLWAFLPKPPADEDDPMTGSSPTSTNDDANASSPAQTKKTQPQRQLDILREHRPYCPYVVRSTVLPSLPAPPAQQNGLRRSESVSSLAGVNGWANTNANANANAMEGWRAVMAVVSRYGTVQRQRLGLSRASTVRGDSNGDGSPGGNAGEGVGGVDDEESSIEAMVAGVKSHGGKDLLKYVKGLLG
ncbi:zf-C3HC-domain-containing protein [Dichomitus squalens LYAD-421 SS1]|uniref:zf-C3HC-domain-containing protein n=1 Tax=Dichomitus squalens (strain LYAD-421) TaxID=732165 RepID=UPI00044131D1|nr:zf-C3HC-domain-containing protein [Dichomitus squalens LYAD-421 SS1]EJF64550.1 zf-C3HC-domain-containing protein [Dichomitus squalens LYAD-421 SS1]